MSDDLLQRLRAPMWRFVPPDVARVADAEIVDICDCALGEETRGG